MPVIKHTPKRNDKSQPPTKGGGGNKARSSLQSAAQKGQKDASATAKGTTLSGPTDYTQKSGGLKLAHSTVSYATAATASTSLSSAAESWTIGTLGGIVIEKRNTAELKSNAPTQLPRGDQGGANSGGGDIVKNPISRELTPLGEDDNKRRERSHSPRPATSSRPQHNQEIRLVMEGTGTSMREGPVIKYHGSGSPCRKGTETDNDEEEDSMNDRSDIRSIQATSDDDDITSDKEEEMSKPSSKH